jgi:hypothetical protein
MSGSFKCGLLAGTITKNKRYATNIVFSLEVKDRTLTCRSLNTSRKADATKFEISSSCPVTSASFVIGFTFRLLLYQGKGSGALFVNNCTRWLRVSANE